MGHLVDYNKVWAGLYDANVKIAAWAYSALGINKEKNSRLPRGHSS
jgi:hypothetical protein